MPTTSQKIIGKFAPGITGYSETDLLCIAAVNEIRTPDELHNLALENTYELRVLEAIAPNPKTSDDTLLFIEKETRLPLIVRQNPNVVADNDFIRRLEVLNALVKIELGDRLKKRMSLQRGKK